jgi:hypothetical protein
MSTQVNERKMSPAASALLQRKQIEAALIARSWEDDAFRKKLLADPRGVIAEAFGFELPASVTVKAQEESPNALVLSLPAKPRSSGELSDVDLEQVAGGAKGSVGNSKVTEQTCFEKAYHSAALHGMGQFIGYSWGWTA